MTRCIRSGCCAEKKEEPLDWEGESEQTAKPFGWQRGLAAILAAAVMLAAGVCGSLAAIGPRYCGEITIAQFAANFNRSASQLSTQNAGKLTRDGVWTSRDTNTFLLMNVPPFGYETDENGRLQSVSIEADGGAAFGARPTGLMQLALYAFAGAQKAMREKDPDSFRAEKPDPSFANPTGNGSPTTLSRAAQAARAAAAKFGPVSTPAENTNTK